MILLVPYLMIETPQVVDRKAVPYVSIRASVDGQNFSSTVQKLIPKLDQWVAKNKVASTGLLIIRYNYVDMPKRMDVEIGLVTRSKSKGGGDVVAGEIPAGRYVSYTHFGDYAGLVEANGKVQSFAKEKGLSFKMLDGNKGRKFGGRFELYETDPAKEPDKSKWQTKVVYLLK